MLLNTIQNPIVSWINVSAQPKNILTVNLYEGSVKSINKGSVAFYFLIEYKGKQN